MPPRIGDLAAFPGDPEAELAAARDYARNGPPPPTYPDWVMSALARPQAARNPWAAIDEAEFRRRLVPDTGMAFGTATPQEATQTEAARGKGFADFVVPQEPWEIGLAAAGPVGRLAGKAGRAAMTTAGIYGSTGGEAQAGKMGGMGSLAAPPMGIRAYHSSPHDFDRFDLSKIGTGEGAQMYGHGLYFAENPKISGQGGEYWQQFARRFEGTPEGHAASRLRAEGWDRDRALAAAQRDAADWKEMLSNARPDQVKYFAQMRDLRQKEAELIASNKPIGPRTYEVNINARPEEFLDWDKPLVQQPAAWNALHRAGYQLPAKPITRDDLSVLRAKYGDWGNMQAQGLEPLLRKTGADFAPKSADTTNALREVGIPGIRYLDQGSRQRAADIANAETVMRQNVASNRNDYGAWQEELDRLKQTPLTNNYVLFDPNRVDILKKYGVAGAAATGAYGAAGDEAQAGRLPPRVGVPGAMPGIVGRNVPALGERALPVPEPIDTRGPWGQAPLPVARGTEGAPRPRLPSDVRTDAALAAIREALRRGRPANSGVPLMRERIGQAPSVEEVLRMLRDINPRE